MKISKVETKLFEHTSYVESDDEGHGHPAKDPRKVSQCMVIIETVSYTHLTLPTKA